MLDKAINTVIMPFGIKLKRTGRYILSHKNSFLIRVQLLDNSVMECTLTVENTGSDCLNAVAQKLDLRETRYFGLKYYNKQQRLRWVELDKPLKKQMDKYAHEPNLFFSIMFYIANIDRLQQEITRYLFYLQVKNNVIDGSLTCKVEEAVELASYMLQAEFGDYDSGTHNMEYYRDFILFCENLTPNVETLDALTMRTIEYHKKHRGLSPADAELNYILKAIHLDGFSEELLPAKNELGNDVDVGCSFAGVVIKPHGSNREHAINSICHEWPVVEHAFHSKTTLTLEVRRSDSSLSAVHLHLDDSESAKYLWRMFEAKRKFYLQNKDSLKRKMAVESTSLIQRRPTLRRYHDSGSDDLNEQVVPVQAASSVDFVSSQENLYGDQYYSSETSLDRPFVSQTSLNHFNQQDVGHSNGYIIGGSMYSSPSANSLTQVGRPSPAASNLSINSSDRRQAPLRNRVGLPMYRHSPDYDVAVREQQQRRRYSSYLENNHSVHPGNQSTSQHPANVPQPSLKPRPHSMIYSQQELQHQAVNGPRYAQYPQQHPPLYYSRSHPPHESSTGQIPMGSQQHILPHKQSHESVSPPSGAHPQPHVLHNPRNGVPHSSVTGVNQSIFTGSTPELANPALQQGKYFVSEMQLYRHFPNPPPAQQRVAGSTSTPDLTQHYQSVSASSPELYVQAGITRRHQPLPTVESYNEDTYNSRRIPPIPASASFDHNERQSTSQLQTPEQNVQAYLQQVTLGDHNRQPQDVVSYSRLSQDGSNEHLFSDGLHDNARYHGSSSNLPHQQYDNVEFHHSHAPSNATMLVYDSDVDNMTDDYLLSQQLQDQARDTNKRVTRSSEFLSQENLNNHHHHQVSPHYLVQSLQQMNMDSDSTHRPATPEPQKNMPVHDVYQSSPERGPPPPYATPPPEEPDEVNEQQTVGDYVEDDDNAFHNARRNTYRKMAPLKFAAMNGLNPTRRSSSPVKGEPDERVLQLEAKVDEGRVLTEYDSIPATRGESAEVESLLSRDRVKEITPYRDNRVKIPPTEGNPLGYINASHVKMSVAGKLWDYIACQTPMHPYENEFWQMVWTNNSTVIVLVSKEIEHGKYRCARYWPSSEDNADIPSAVYGEFRVMCRFDNCAPSNCAESCITRNLVLEKEGCAEKRTVWMLQYIGWPETGVPKDPENFLVFLEELDSVRRLARENESTAPPVVVQCTSGSGRTGVLILAQLMIQCLERNQNTSIAEMLTQLRQQRMHFVQTFSQYNFVYKLLISFLRKSRLI